jgi:hypothetical protein
MRLRILILAALLSFYSPLFATPNFLNTAESGGQTGPPSHEMNGIKFSKFKDFESWKQVTVRFRQDTDELRFVYANDAAMKTLKSGKTDYPDGSVFAKYAKVSAPDPAFPVSFEPNGALRVQLMVKDRKRYPDADGWGYAIFDAEGLAFPSDTKSTVASCVSCHRVVASRGFVFSRLPTAFKSPPPPAAPEKKAFVFKDADLEDISPLVVQNASLSTSRVRLLEGEFTDSQFSGTYYELLPILIEETHRTHLPALLIAKNEHRFAVALPAVESQYKFEQSQCRALKQELYRTVLAGVEKPPSSLRSISIRNNLFCK